MDELPINRRPRFCASYRRKKLTFIYELFAIIYHKRIKCKWIEQVAKMYNLYQIVYLYQMPRQLVIISQKKHISSFAR